MVHRRLKFIIPAVQVTAILAVFVWGKLCHSERLLLEYVLPLQTVLKGINFPLAAIWFPIVHVMEKVMRAQPNDDSVTLPALLIGLTLLLSVALFWYFVVAEAQTRRRGTSLLRFSTRLGEVLKTTMLFLLGLGIFLYVLVYARSAWHSQNIQTVLSLFFPTLWGIVFIAISISDFRVLMTAGRELPQP